MNARTDLRRLEASGLIQVAAVQPELEYLFRHALVQDAAYSSLLKQDRRTLHRGAAETILALYPERRRELAAVIAMHFERADDLVNAAEYFVLAGEHAVERFANREALAFFERTDELLTPDDPRPELRLRAAIGAAHAGWTFSGPSVPIERLERAVRAAGERGDGHLLVDAYFWIAFLRQRSGEVMESSPALRDAVEQMERLGEAVGDPTARAMTKAFLGTAMMFTGHLREGVQLADGALATLEGSADPLSTAMLSGFLAMTYARLGEFDAAERSLTRADRLAKRGDEIARLDAQISRSALYVERGDADDAAALATRCAATSEELGAVACAVGSNVMLGTARLALEDVRGAKDPSARGYELSLVTNQVPMRTLAQGMLASIRTRLGEVPAEGAGWDEVLARARETGDRFAEASTLWQRARTQLHGTPPEWTPALTDLDAAAALFKAMDAQPSLARVQRDRGQALAALGRDAEREDAEKQSAEIAARIGLRDLTAR